MLKTYVAVVRRLSALHRDESGAFTFEYAVLVGMIALAAIAALTTLSPRLNPALN